MSNSADIKREVISQINTYLTDRHWTPNKIANQEIIYAKNKPAVATKEYRFLDYSKKRNPCSWEELSEAVTGFFQNREYLIGKKNSIINNHQDDTFFIVAGIQFFSDYFHGTAPMCKDKYFVPQPVVRTKFRNQVQEGCLSSFVNLSTIQCNSTIDNHVEHINAWLDFLSANSIYCGDLELKLSMNYGKNLSGFWKKTDGIVLKFNYGGLELGDAGLIFFNERPNELISEVGFGFERILWAINKTASFFDLIGPNPQTFATSPKVIDAFRTSTLIALSGLNQNQEDQLHQFRKYIDTIAEQVRVDSFTFINHYAQFWSKFIEPAKSIQEATQLIHEEAGRKRNLELARKLGIEQALPEIIRLSPDKFIEHLRRVHNIPFNTIKQASQ